MELNKLPGKNRGRLILWIIPLLSLCWCLFFTHLMGPFYLTRIDPEYIYLFNGLNAAGLHFDRIGHFDHPGTPFQMLTGVFVRCIYTVAGQGSISQDVFSRPEFYLSLSLFFLSLLISGLLYSLGKTAFRLTQKYSAALLLQSGVLLNAYFLSYSCRYLPDVLLEAAGILFSLVVLRYFYDEGFKGRKFAVCSGIIMGIGLVSKINFLPLVIIPFIAIITWKDRMYYIISLVISTFLCFLPVINRFQVTWQLIFNKVTHEGLYGKGEEHMLNMDDFLHNLFLIFRENVAFSIVFLLTLAGILMILLKKELRYNHKKQLAFLAGYLLSVLIALIMVAKHYRDYYFIPVSSLNAIVFYSLYRLGTETFRLKAVKYLLISLFFLLILIPNFPIISYCNYLLKSDLSENPAADYIRDHVSPEDYFLVEPTWESGPLIANGVVYGVSYINHKHVYFYELQPLYPNILTWEGPDKALKYLRMMDADEEVIMKSGRDIYLLSTPGRHADQVCRDFEKMAARQGVTFEKDTVYACSGHPEIIIRYHNINGWRILEGIECGFDNLKNSSIRSDDGRVEAFGSATLDCVSPLKGHYSIKLDSSQPASPVFAIKGVAAGDFIEVTIKRSRNARSDYSDGCIVISETASGKASETLQQQPFPFFNIHEEWAMLRLKANVVRQPPDSILYCRYQYAGNTSILLDDLSIGHCRGR